MKTNLTQGVFLRRYKRFFADVELDGAEVVTAHCPNTGTMKTLIDDRVAAWLTWHDNPKRKLPWTLTLLGLKGGGSALVDTALPNRLVEEAVLDGRIPELGGYETLRREVRYGEQKSRIDLLLEDCGSGGPICYVEVKNVTMASATTPGRADFPDACTERGQKHMRELTAMAKAGHRAVQFFLLSRTDCDRVGLAREIDEVYAKTVEDALAAGVEVIAYRLEILDGEMTLGERCPFDVSSGC